MPTDTVRVNVNRAGYERMRRVIPSRKFPALPTFGGFAHVAANLQSAEAFSADCKSAAKGQRSSELTTWSPSWRRLPSGRGVIHWPMDLWKSTSRSRIVPRYSARGFSRCT